MNKEMELEFIDLDISELDEKPYTKSGNQLPAKRCECNKLEETRNTGHESQLNIISGTQKNSKHSKSNVKSDNKKEINQYKNQEDLQDTSDSPNEKKTNMMSLRFDSYPENEAFARTAVSAFLVELNPTIDELDDVKTAVSEAVTNSIIHGYPEGKGVVQLDCVKNKSNLQITVTDWGCGIADVEKAKEPFFTTKPEMERSGMGFAFMETFMDELYIESVKEKGTKVIMYKRLGMQG